MDRSKRTPSKFKTAVNVPDYNDKTVQPVPFVLNIALLPSNSHGHHLDNHLRGEVDEYDSLNFLQNLATESATVSINRVIHRKGDAVDKDDEHADALEPSTRSVKDQTSYPNS